MDYKLHKMENRHKKRSPNRVHGEPGGQVFMVIGCSGLGNLSMTSESKTYKTNKNNLPKHVDGRVKKCPSLGMILWTRRYQKKRVKD